MHLLYDEFLLFACFIARKGDGFCSIETQLILWMTWGVGNSLLGCMHDYIDLWSLPLTLRPQLLPHRRTARIHLDLCVSQSASPRSEIHTIGRRSISFTDQTVPLCLITGSNLLFTKSGPLSMSLPQDAFFLAFRKLFLWSFSLAYEFGFGFGVWIRGLGLGFLLSCIDGRIDRHTHSAFIQLSRCLGGLIS